MWDLLPSPACQWHNRIAGLGSCPHLPPLRVGPCWPWYIPLHTSPAHSNSPCPWISHSSHPPLLGLHIVPTPTERQWYLLAKCSIRECVSACGNIGEEAGLEESSKGSEDQRQLKALSSHHPPCLDANKIRRVDPTLLLRPESRSDLC